MSADKTALAATTSTWANPKMGFWNFYLSTSHAVFIAFFSIYALNVEKYYAFSIIISTVYFFIIGFFEQPSWANFLHHVLGILSSFYFLWDSRYQVVYVMVQTAEVSTPFLHLYKEFGHVWAGIVFIPVYFLSRIVYYPLRVLPYGYQCAQECGLTVCWFVFAMALIFYGLQWYWFVKILRRARRDYEDFMAKRKKAT
jgi:hypothetical protein